VKTGAIIPLAWPETLVINEGKWYDKLLKYTPFQKNGYYKVGHAAMVLVDYKSQEFHYFDFGRYHTPLKFGRVRDKETDPDVTIPFSAILCSQNNIQNIDKLFSFLFKNKACHGDGKLVASIYKNIDFSKAFEKAKQMQNKGIINYGPLTIGGTNCSRFVTQTTKAIKTDFFTFIMTRIPYTFSPSPMLNVRVINSYSHYFITNENGVTKHKNLITFFKKND
jgi:hypothetical protein